MSPLQEKPILHGRDHCPGGADPIPCMISGPSGDFSGVLLATGPFAYWRLGETGEPWADTSGAVGFDAADLAEAESGTALSANVTGALSTDDDGALEFNYDGTASGGGRYAKSAYATPPDKDFDIDDEMTVCAWVKVKAAAATRRGHIIGTSWASAIGNGYDIGWGLQVTYPGREIRFTRGQQSDATPELYAETSGGVVAGEWNFFVGTYDTETIRLYVNGELVDSTADPNTSPSSVDHFIRLGFAHTNDAVTPGQNVVYSWFYGTIDEAAVWTRALSQAEIDALYAAGVEGAGTGEQVLLADGQGGTYWGQLPAGTVEPGTDGQVLQTLGGVSVWGSAPAGDPATDTSVWMPLADSDGILVLDADDAVIPTLIPI